MSRLTVQLQIDEQMALAELARQERRDARNQAAVIIRRELERRGLLSNEQVEPLAATGGTGKNDARR